MNNLAREKLCEILTTGDHSLCDDARRVRALLNDHCPILKREIHVLVSAMEQRVVSELRAPWSGPWEMVATRLTARLEDECALAQEAARWAVESWAIALGKSQPSATRPAPTASLPDTDRTPLIAP